MKYEIVPSNQFKKDLKLAQKRGYDLEKIKKVIATLANGGIYVGTIPVKGDFINNLCLASEGYRGLI